MAVIETLYWNIWAQVALAALIVAIVSGLADRMRLKRANLDAVGFMPWTAISALSLLIAVLCAAIAFSA